MSTTPEGFLFVDKPVGPTSHDVVAAVRRRFGRQTRVGHAGTLDPLASGLLVLGVGRATKLLGRLARHDKTYQVAVTLGATSATDDAEGRVEPRAVHRAPTRAAVEATLAKFTGEQQQIPPPYSAKKVAGQPAWRLARRGQSVTLKPQRVTVYALTLGRYEYPTLEVTVRCSSGTYVRALARDIGAALGTGGYVTRLRRTAVGPYEVAAALTLEAIRQAPILDRLLTPSATILARAATSDSALTAAPAVL